MGARVEEGGGPESTSHLFEVLPTRLVAMQATVALVPGMQEVSLVDQTDAQGSSSTLNRSVRVTFPVDINSAAFTEAVDTAEWILKMQSLLKLHRFLGDPPNKELTNEYRRLYARERDKEVAEAQKKKRRPETRLTSVRRYRR